MTRFARELAGELGEYWQGSAQRELEKIKAELEQGLITIDEQGIGRNRIGRVLTSEMTEKVSYFTDRIDPEATARARDEETTKALEAYRRNYKGPSEEEKAEMRATFGAGWWTSLAASGSGFKACRKPNINNTSTTHPDRGRKPERRSKT